MSQFFVLDCSRWQHNGTADALKVLSKLNKIFRNQDIDNEAELLVCRTFHFSAALTFECWSSMWTFP